MTFTEYRNRLDRGHAAQRRLERLTYFVAVVVGLCGAILLGATLSGCAGQVADDQQAGCPPTMFASAAEVGKNMPCGGCYPTLQHCGSTPVGSSWVCWGNGASYLEATGCMASADGVCCE